MYRRSELWRAAWHPVLKQDDHRARQAQSPSLHILEWRLGMKSCFGSTVTNRGPSWSAPHNTSVHPTSDTLHSVLHVQALPAVLALYFGVGGLRVLNSEAAEMLAGSGMSAGC